MFSFELEYFHNLLFNENSWKSKVYETEKVIIIFEYFMLMFFGCYGKVELFYAIRFTREGMSN